MNPLLNIYKIDRSNPEYIIITTENDEFKLDQTHETFRVEDCFITRIVKEENGYVQYTDINGISSETLLTDKDFAELAEDVQTDTDYCVLAIHKLDEPENTFYAYIELKH